MIDVRTQGLVALPAKALGPLRESLAAECDPDPAARALRAAGTAMGGSIFDLLSGGLDAAPGELPAERFWPEISGILAELGWGSFDHHQVHPGVGALRTSDGAEAAEGEGTRPSCHLTAGLLAGLLGGLSDDPVAVLEVECRSSGAPACRFLFGGEQTLRTLHGSLVEGRDVNASLEALG